MTRPESNGGVSCPDLHQKKACRGDSCIEQQGRHKKHDNTALRGEFGANNKAFEPDCEAESAMILPAKYGELEDEKYDVRQNLRTFKEEENEDQ